MPDNRRAYYKENKTRIRLVVKTRRRNDVAGTILNDSRKADRKRGRVNDLDLAFVQEAVAEACRYCGETTIRMTLDRIDNTLGHMKANVVPACERCNFARRDMPYAAWLLVAEALRKAREQGLFGRWTGGIHHRLELDPTPPPPSSLRAAPEHGTLARYFKCGPPRCDECRHAMRDWKRGRREALA